MYPHPLSNNAINFDISFGRLIFPRAYTGYKQTNMNVMVEFLGQSLLGNGKQFMDVAALVQFIFNNHKRVDIRV